MMLVPKADILDTCFFGALMDGKRLLRLSNTRRAIENPTRVRLPRRNLFRELDRLHYFLTSGKFREFKRSHSVFCLLPDRFCPVLSSSRVVVVNLLVCELRSAFVVILHMIVRILIRLD
jgi:hypothetical protein